MSPLRAVIVPLCAAFAAALFAHVGIDVLGDYLLPHDSYDDVAHGSRSIVLGIGLATFASLFACGLAAAIREACGSVDEFSRALHSSLSLAFAPFVAATFSAAALILAAMESLDKMAAGRAVDDVGDLFGGSLRLGLATVALAAVVCALGARIFVRALAGVRRTVVDALAVVFAPRAIAKSVHSSLVYVRVRIVVETHFIGKSRSGRAPPVATLGRPSFL